MNRNQRLKIWRNDRWAEYTVSISETACVLDALEEAWKQDKTLMFRHACHHASCGSCGLRVNGRERLACKTKISEVARSGRPIRLEPLKNFPVIGDLVVDLREVFEKTQAAGFTLVRSVEAKNLPDAIDGWTQMQDCIECGLCVSACPIMGSDSKYFGPAALAAGEYRTLDNQLPALPGMAERLIDEHGVWRCHGAFECNEVCPNGVEPGSTIMMLRRRLLVGASAR